MLNPAKALLIDHEIIALKNLKSLIERNCSGEIDISGMANSTEEAPTIFSPL